MNAWLAHGLDDGSSRSPVPRRGFLATGATAATAGLVTMVLPGAVAAYSVIEGFGGEVPVTPSDPIVAAWGGGNLSSYLTTSSSTLSASKVTTATTISAYLGTGGPFYTTYSGVNGATAGIGPANDNRFWIYYKYRASSLDVSDQNAPYLRWRITAGSTPIALKYFYSGFNSTGTTNASFRTSLDDYRNSIRDFTAPGDGTYRIVRVDLTGIPVIGAGSSIDFRMYLYNTNLSSNAATVYLGHNYSGSSGITANDSYQSEMGYYAMGFIHR